MGLQVTYNHQARHVKIMCFLSYNGDQFTVARNMAGIAKHFKAGYPGLQLNGKVPHRGIPKRSFLKRGKPTVDGHHFFNACTAQSLQGTNPQFKIRIYWILDHDRDVYAAKRISNLLDRKWIYCSAGTQPKNIHSRFKAGFNMSSRSHLR